MSLWQASVAKPCTSKAILLLVQAPWWLDPAVSTRPPSPTGAYKRICWSQETPPHSSPGPHQTFHTVSLQILSNTAPWHFSERSKNLPAQRANWCVKQLSNLITQRSAAIRSLYLLRMLWRAETEVCGLVCSEEKIMCRRPDLHSLIHFFFSHSTSQLWELAAKSGYGARNPDGMFLVWIFTYPSVNKWKKERNRKLLCGLNILIAWTGYILIAKYLKNVI